MESPKWASKRFSEAKYLFVIYFSRKKENPGFGKTVQRQKRFTDPSDKDPSYQCGDGKRTGRISKPFPNGHMWQGSCSWRQRGRAWKSFWLVRFTELKQRRCSNLSGVMHRVHKEVFLGHRLHKFHEPYSQSNLIVLMIVKTNLEKQGHIQWCWIMPFYPRTSILLIFWR